MEDNTPSSKKLQSRGLNGTQLRKRFWRLEKTGVRHAKRFVTKRLDRLANVRRHIIGWVILVAVLVGASAWQWLNYRSFYMVEAPQAGGSFSEGVLGPLDTLNPIYARTSAEKSAAKLLFAGLYRYDDSGSLAPDLASSLSIDSSETVYTISLIKGLKWSDGADLLADDVVFTVELLKNRATRAELTGWDAIAVKKIDATTVEFTVPAPYAPFQHALTFPILPKHTLGEVSPAEMREHSFGQAPITSGPFAMRSLQVDSSGGGKKIVQLVANPYYHRGLAKLERFQLHSYSSRQDIVRGLQTNEIAATAELSYGFQDSIFKKDFVSTSHQTNSGVYALFNTSSALMSSAKLRQALAIGVNTSDLRQKLQQSTAPLYGPILHDQVSEDLVDVPGYDLDKAKKLLDEDGWVLDGKTRRKGEQQLQIAMVALKGSEYEGVAKELSQAWTNDLGVIVELRIIDPLDPAQNVLQSILQPRNFDILIYEFVLGGDPDVLAYWHSSQATPLGLNFANYKNAIADDALASGRSRLGDKRRADRYQSFVRRWVADMPAVPLYRVRMDFIHKAGIKTLRDDARYVYPADRYGDVVYWTVNQASVYKTP